MEKKRNCYVFLANGFSDWEAALLLAGLNQFTDFNIVYFTADGKPVKSIGGIRVVPDARLDQVKADRIDLLVLPGGLSWSGGENEEIEALLKEVIQQDKPIAAICDATVFLARQGYLNTIRHTSNHIMFLQELGRVYQGEDWYVNKPCVREGNFITASGTAGLEFAEEVFRYFDLLNTNRELAFWFGFFQIHQESTQAGTNSGVQKSYNAGKK